jgi:surface protein
MSSMFSGAQIFNNDITRWDTSNVTDMSYMFSNAYDFNQPIFSYWDTSKVTNMAFMFAYATTFNNAGVTNAIAGSWNTSNVTNMSYMFLNCFKFNTPIGGFNTSKVTNMSFMFANNYIFNQPIGGWDTSQVTDMTNMFQNCTAFNQPIGNWNTSKVTSMQAMFASAVSFNNGFSLVTPYSGYLDIHGFILRYGNNQTPINSIYYAQKLNWDVSQVTNMHIMFIGASSFFNVFIAHWNVRDNLYFEGFRRDCPIPDEFTPYKIVSQGGGR